MSLWISIPLIAELPRVLYMPDLDLSETSNFSGNVTQVPIESRESIGDHYARNNPTFSFTTVITPKVAGNPLLRLGRAAQIQRDLEKIWRNGEAFSVITSRGITRKNLFLTGLTDTRTFDNQTGLISIATLEQVRIRDVSLTENIAASAADSQGAIQNLGTQAVSA